MATTHTIQPPDRTQVVIHGDVNAAREAVAKWIGIHRPLRDTVVVRHNVHCTVWVEDWDRLFVWFRQSLRRPAQPGDLLLWWTPTGPNMYRKEVVVKP